MATKKMYCEREREYVQTCAHGRDAVFTTRATTRQRDAVLGATIAALLDVPASSADIGSFVRTATTAVATLNTCTTNASRR